MALAVMLATDKDALVCDLAETYGVLEMEALPVQRLAVLSFGLRENSRIKLRIAGMHTDMQTLMLAGCFDMLAILIGGEKPKQSMYALVSGITVDSGETVGFDTPEDYEAARAQIIKEAQNGN